MKKPLKHPSVTDPVVSICSPGFPRKRHLVGKFSTRFRLSVRSLFCLFQHTNYLFGNIKAAPGKSLTGRVKFKISTGTWDAKFSLGEGKNALGRVSLGLLGPIYTVRFLSHATSARQAYDMIYNCRSVLKHVLKCCGNRKSCRKPMDF